jgi:fibronectin-binding autotransporter adhesin
MKARRPFSLPLLVVLTVIALWPSPPVSAAVYTWDSSGTGAAFDGSGTWSTTNANWWTGAGDIDWTTGADSAILGMGALANSPYVVTLGSNIAAASITFNNQSYTIAGNTGGQFSLSVGGGGITANAPATISAPVALAATQQWFNNSSGALTVTKPVYIGGNSLTLSGSGLTSLAGGVAGGAGGLVVAPGANVALSTGSGVALNGYAGPTAIGGGVLTLQAPAAPAISTDAQLQTYLAQQGLLNNLLAWFDPSSAANYITSGGSVTTLINLSPSNSGSVGNATTITGSNHFNAPALNVNNPAFNGKTTLYFGGQNVLGELNLAAMNSAPYTIFAIQAKSSNPGTGADHFLGTMGNPISYTNTALQLGYKADTSYLAGQFGNDLSAAAPGFTGAEVANEFTAELNLASGRTLYTNGTPVAGGYLANYTGLSTLGQAVSGAVNPINYGVLGASYITNSSDTAFNGYFQGDVGEILMFNVPLTAAQRQVIDTYLQYKWYNPTILPQLSPVTLGAPAGSGGTLNLNGVNSTIGSLGSSDPTTAVQLGTATLTTGGLNTSTAFAGSISGAGGLNKVGVGAMVLSGTNTYAGATNVGAGTLQINGSYALPAGSLVYIGSATLSYLNDGSGNGGTISAGNNITLFWNTNNANINVGALNTTNTGNTVAFGALSVGTTANALNGTVIFTAANGYRQSYTGLNLGGLTGNGFTLNPTTTTVLINGNVTNQELGVIAGHFDTLFLGGTSTGNTITGSITDAVSGGTSGGYTAVTMNGSGQWILSGTNLPYHGNTTISSGSLALQSNYLPINSPVLLGAATLQLLNNGIGGNAGNNATINTAFSAGSGTIDISSGIATDNIYVGSVGGTNSGNTIAVSVLANGTGSTAQTSTINFLGGNGYALSIGTLGLSAGGGDGTTLNPTSTTLGVQNVVNQITSNTGFDTFYLDGTSSGNVVSGVISDRPGYALQTSGGSLKGETNVSVNGAGSWTGGFSSSGSALWILTSSESYHGWTTINGGTLQLGTGQPGQDGALPAFSANSVYPYVVNNGTLVYNLYGSQTANYSITGNGSLRKMGSNSVLTLTGTGNTYSGGTTINSGTLQIGAGGSSGAITSSSGIVNNGVLAFDQSNAVTYANSISGSGSVYQIGGGTTTISSAAGFTGPTVVSSGALFFNGPNNTSGINVAGGAMLGGGFSASNATAAIASGGILVTGNAAPSSATLGGLSFAGSGAINAGGLNSYYASAGTAAAVSVTANNGLAANGAAGAVTINLSGPGPVAPGNYHVLGYSGTIGGAGFSGFSLNTSGLASVPNNASFTLANNPAYVDVNFSLSNYPIWTGNNSTAWDTSTQNWQSYATSAATTFNANDFAYFGDSGVANTTITMTSSVAPYAAYFANNVLSYTLSGSSGIGGTAALVMNGNGSLTVNNTNTFTGGTFLYNGLLNVGNASALGGAASTLTLAGGTLDNTSGGPLTLNYPVVISGGFTYLGSSNPLNLGAGPITLSANSKINVAGNTLTMGGVISGNYGLTQTGAGTLLLTAADTYAGNTLVRGGSLVLGNASALQNSALDTSGAGSVNFGALTSATVGGLTNGGALTLANSSGAAVTLSVGNNNLNNVSSASIGGAGGITKIGSGLQALSGNNTYTGGTNLSAGTLQFQGAAGSTGLPGGGTIGIGANATLSIANDGGGSGGTISLGANNSSITLTAAGVTTTIDSRNNGSGNTNNVVVFGTLSNGTSANAFNSTINFTGANGYTQSYAGLALSGLTGQGTTLNPTTTTVIIAGNVTNSESGTVSGHFDTLTLGGSSLGNEILGTISDSYSYSSVGNGDTRVTKTGASQWTLAGANTYHGPTTISAGTLALGVNGSINNSLSISMSSSATFDVSAVSGGFALLNSQTLSGLGSYNINGGMTVNSGATVLPGGLAANSSGTLNVGSLTLQAGSVLGYELVSGTSTDLINVGNPGGLTVNGGGIYLYGASGTSPFATPGTYPLLAYSGALGGSPANLSVLNPVSPYSYVFSTSGSMVDLNILVANTWAGNGGGAFNWGNGANWTSGLAPSSGSAVMFAGTTGLANSNDISGLNLTGIVFAANAGAFNLSGNSLQLSGPIVNNSTATQTVGLGVQLTGNQTITAASGNIVLAGVLSDAGSGYGITIGGTNTVALSAANTFSGPTTVASGRLDLAHGLALQNSTLTLTGGSLAFDSSVSGAAFSLGGLSGGGNINLATVAGSPVALSVGGNNANTNLSGVLSGAGSLNKTGSGTVVLSGANTFTGNTLVSGGILQLTNASALQNSALDNSGAGQINWATLTAVTLGGLTNGGNLNLLNNLGQPVTLSVGNNNLNNASAAAISGSGGITKIGAGLQALSGNNTYTGATIISAGTLQFQGGSSLSSAPTSGTISLNGGVAANVGVLSVHVDGTGSNGTIGGPANIVSTVASGDVYTIDVGNNGSANTGNTVSFGTLANGPVNAGWISTFYFTGANGYLQSYASVGLSASGGQNTFLYPVSTTVLINNVVNRENTTASGHFDTLTLDGDTTGNTIYGVIADSSIYQSVGNGDTRITKQNSSQWILAAANTYHGPTSIAGGTLQLGTGAAGQDGALYTGTAPNASSVTLSNSATLAFMLSPSAGGLGSVPYLISGAGNVAVLSGSVTFSAADTYTLPTTIGGTLALAGTGSIASTRAIVLGNGAALDVSAVSPWSLRSGQTLTGTGSYNVFGTATIAAGSTLLPGGLVANSAGTLNVGGLTLGGGGLGFEMGANQDLINVTGSNGLNIGSATTLNFFDSSGTNQFSSPGTWPVMVYSGTLGGTLGNLSVGNPNLNAVYTFSTSATAGGGVLDLNVLSALGWTGSAGAPFRWSVGGNWASGVAIANGQAPYFQGATGLTNVNDIAGLSLPGIIFAANAGAFNLSGNSVQINGAITNSSTATQTIGLNLQLNGNPSVNALAGNILLNGVLSDAGSGYGISVNGPNAVVLGAANTFTGPTNIASGALNLAHPLAVQYSTVNISPSGALTFAAGNTSPSVGGLAGAGNIALATAASQSVMLNVGGNGQSTTYSGVLSGVGGLLKSGGGTLTLAAPLPHSYSGATLITGGVLQIAQARGSIGIQLGPSGYAIVGSDGPVPMSNWNTLVGANPSGANLINSSGVATAAAISISGASGTVHDSDLDQLLSNYIYTGTSPISITVNLTGIPYSYYNLYAISADETAGHTNQLTMGGTNFYFTAATPATDSGTFIQITNTSSATNPIGNYAVVSALSGPNQTVTNTSGADTGFSGIEIVNAGQLLSPNSPVAISNGAMLDMTNSFQLIPSLSSTDGLGSQVLLGAGQLNITGPGTTTFDGVISDGGAGGSLVVQGGQLTLTGQNTYAGMTTVSGGVLQFSSSAGPAIASNLLVSGGTAQWLLSNQLASTSQAIVSAGLLNIGANSNTLAGVQITGGTIAGTTGVLTSTTAYDARNGVISAILAGTVGLNKTTSGVVSLAAPNSYTGNTSVSAGTLTLAHPLAVQNSTVSLGSGGALGFSQGTVSPLLGGLSGGSALLGVGNIALATAASEPVLLNVGHNGQNTTYGGILSGPGGLVKVGPGTLTLSATQTYSGPTRVSGGVLQLVGQSTFPTLLADNLLSTSLNPANWTTNTSSAAGGAAVTPTVNGVQLVKRGYLNTASQYDPVALGGIMITGNWQFGSATDFMQIDTRSDATPNPANQYGEITSGLEFYYQQGNATPGFNAPTGDTTFTESNVATTGTLTINGTADKLAFDAIDYGNGNLSFTVADLTTNTTSTATATVTGTALENYVTFHNRENGTGSYVSNVVISIATPVVSGANNLLPATTPLTITSGGTLDMTNATQTIASLSSTDGLGSQVLMGSGGLTITGPASTTFDGVISGNGGSLTLGGGRLTLTGANTYSGPTTISGGTLQLGSGQSGQDGSIANTSGVTNNGALVYNLFGAQTINYAIAGNANGSVTKAGPGALTLANTNNSYGGGTNVLQGLLVISPNSFALPYGSLNVSGGSLDLEGNIAVVSTLSGNGTIGNGAQGVANSATLFVEAGGNFSGSIQDGGFGGNAPLSLELDGGGLVLKGANSFSGPTTITGGALVAAAPGALSPFSAVTVSGGTLDVTASPQTVPSLDVSTGALNLMIGNLLTVSGGAGLGGGTLDVFGSTGGSQELISYLSYSGSFATINGLPAGFMVQYAPTQLDLVLGPKWSKGGNGSWSNGANWSTGRAPNGATQPAVLIAATSASVAINLDVPVTVGSILFSNSSGSPGVGYTISGSNVLTLDNSGATALIAVNAGSQMIAVPVVLNDNLSITTSAGSTLAIAGNISEGAAGQSVTLNGLGTLILSGTDSYTGGTNVEGGILVAALAAALPNGSNLTVGQGGGALFAPAGSMAGSTAGPVLAAQTIVAVPEPGAMALLAAGLAIGIGIAARRGKRISN